MDNSYFSIMDPCRYIRAKIRVIFKMFILFEMIKPFFTFI